MGAAGDADVVLVHARAQEDEFVANGDGMQRYDVMYNDFIIVGPADDPAAKQMGRLGREAAAAGGPPSPEQMAQMQALQKRLSGGTYWIGGLLLVTVITMAIARYIRF